MVEACRQHYGRVDVLVNNVGGSLGGGAAELTPEQWDSQLANNLTSVYLLCNATLPIMMEQQQGAIVNIASTSGLRYSGSPQIG
jgi:NAD(P)-dependent dehydrogenase (short-subunit alcohol dehydrogenase family)